MLYSDKEIRPWPQDWYIHIVTSCKLYFDGMQGIPIKHIHDYFEQMGSPVICAETWNDIIDLVKINRITAFLECGNYLYSISFSKYETKDMIHAIIFRKEDEMIYIGQTNKQTAYDCISVIEDLILEDYWENRDDDDDNDDDFDPIIDPSNSRNLQSSFS